MIATILVSFHSIVLLVLSHAAAVAVGAVLHAKLSAEASKVEAEIKSKL